MGSPEIEVVEAFRWFRSGVETIRAVDGVDLVVKAGEMACIYGASGSGKTTLLNLVAGLDVADRGVVKVAGRDLTLVSHSGRAKMRLHSIGVIFQENNLVPEFTALDNVLVPLLARGRAYSVATVEATAELARVGIGGLAGRSRPRWVPH